MCHNINIIAIFVAITNHKNYRLMKKKSLLFRLVVLMAFFTCVMSASAEDINFSSGGIYYSLTIYSDGRGVVSVPGP